MRLLTQLAWEFRLQKRYYFFATALVISAVWLVLLFSLSDAVKSRWMPVLIFADLSNIGLLFIAGCLFLERRQGTLYALAITPVSRGHWLTLKLISLGCLTSACALVIVGLSGISVQWWLLVPAVMVTAVLFTLCGFLVALPFDDILNYFLLMALSMIVLSLPLFEYFDVYSHWMFWLLPTQPLMQLLTNAFQPAAATATTISVLLAIAWIAVLFVIAQRQFGRFVAMRSQS